MRLRRLLWSGVGVVGTVGAIGGAWMLSLPPARGFASPPPIGKFETEALLAALKPPKRQRPIIASIGINDATETTDYLTSGATFPDGEADQLQPGERAGIGLEDHFRVGQLPWGLPVVLGMTRTDTGALLPFDTGPPWRRRGSETDGAG